jgi:plastocyanin
MVRMTIEPNRSEQHCGTRGSPWALAALVAAALLLVSAGCGDDDEGGEATPGTTASTTAAGDDYGGAGGGGEGDGEAGTIVAADFELSSTSVAAGGEVTFRNDDGTAHTVTADDGAFDTGPVAAGESGTFTAPQAPGEVAFHCEIHPSMTGTLTVEG